MTTTLLIEIGVEELPTKAVTALATAGRDLWAQALSDAALAHGNIDTFATPRRLAWRIHDLAEKQPDQKSSAKARRWLPPKTKTATGQKPRLVSRQAAASKQATSASKKPPKAPG